jgi:hypothetical protein
MQSTPSMKNADSATATVTHPIIKNLLGQPVAT